MASRDEGIAGAFGVNSIVEDFDGDFVAKIVLAPQLPRHEPRR
jgi:hypothetical protein